MKNRLLLIIVVSILFSCQEEVVLDLSSVEPIPVIEAIWTDNLSMNKVIFTESKDYFDTARPRSIPGAEIFIKNTRTEERVRFIYSEGLRNYIPEENRVGTIGEEYELSVKYNGKEYVSKGTMLEPPIFDSVTYEFQERRIFREEGFYLTIFGKIPFDRENNYRLRIIQNDTLLNSRFDYFLFDDTFGTGFFDEGFELNGFVFRANDNVKLELFRMNRDAFDYINQLANLLFNDGGLFSPPPQNPASNIREINGRGEVLGYFMVSSYLSETVQLPDR